MRHLLYVHSATFGKAKLLPLDLLNQFYDFKLQERFPNVCICLWILLTIPATVTSSEWSFSKLKLARSRRFIPKLFVWHSSRDIVRMKWRYYRAGLYTEKKRSHWLKQWPIRKGLGDKKRWVVIGWRCNLDLVETLKQSTNGKFKRF